MLVLTITGLKAFLIDGSLDSLNMSVWKHIDTVKRNSYNFDDLRGNDIILYNHTELLKYEHSFEGRCNMYHHSDELLTVLLIIFKVDVPTGNVGSSLLFERWRHWAS